MTLERSTRLAPDAAFARLKELIIRRTGHFYYQDKDTLLWERVRRRLQGTGLRDSGAYLERLCDPERGEAEWAALEAEITIGETFFFRYAEQFAALRDTILPALFAANREQRRLRIWSAGCATGAEPYSIAILLRRLLGEETQHWRISILGTDINQSFLAAAREARYGPWALRSIPAEDRMRDFLPAPEGRGWILRPRHRGLVRFERHNLQSLLDGTSPLQVTDFDLILCRNVLIYFHPETVASIVRALGERLRKDGWLLLGHAEPNPAFADFLTPVALPGTVAYRRGATEAAPVQAPAAPGAAELPEPPPPPRPRPSPRRAARPPAPAPVTDAPKDGAAPELDAIQALADRGEIGRAREACRAALREEPLDAGMHLLDGLLARAAGDADGAERAFRRAIFLRKDLVMAHYHLGLLLFAAGRAAEGRRTIGNALRITLPIPDDAVLEASDGMTAAAFRAVARLHL